MPLVLTGSGHPRTPWPEWPHLLPGPSPVPAPVRVLLEWHLPTALLWLESELNHLPQSPLLAPPLGCWVGHTCSCPLSPVPQGSLWALEHLPRAWRAAKRPVDEGLNSSGWAWDCSSDQAPRLGPCTLHACQSSLVLPWLVWSHLVSLVSSWARPGPGRESSILLSPGGTSS